MAFHFLSIFGHEKLNTCLENSGTVGEKCRSFFLACKQNKCVYWRLSLKCISSFLKRLLMYLHSLRNFDVQGVIKLHTILKAILSFYIIVHNNGKYILRCIQKTLNVILHFGEVFSIKIMISFYLYIQTVWSKDAKTCYIVMFSRTY